jgi:type IV fimbrial biogenesis protein FimT
MADCLQLSWAEHVMPNQVNSGIDLQALQSDRQCESPGVATVKTLDMTNSWRVLGFSLIETLFVLLVLAILCGTAVSSFQSLQVRAQVQAASQAFLSDVLSARTEALRRERRVTLCAAALDSGARATPPTACAASGGASAWHQGWLVFEDVNSNGLWDHGEALLQQRARLHASVSATGNATVARYVSFGPSGRSLTLNGAFQAGTITLCARGASGEDAWLLVVNAVGRSRLDKGQMAICP